MLPMLIHQTPQRQERNQQDLIDEAMTGWILEGKIEKIAQCRVSERGFAGGSVI